MRWYPFACLAVSLGCVCRIVFSGEYGAASSPLDLTPLLKDMPLVAFTLFLIWDRRQRDKKDAERDKKDEATALRFQELDREIVVMMKDMAMVTKDNAVAMNITAVAANELRTSVDDLTKLLYTKPCLRPEGAKTRETDRENR